MRLLTSVARGTYDDYADPAVVNFATSLAPFMYCGVIVAEPAVLKLIPPAPPWSIMAGLLAPMVRDGLPVSASRSGYMRTVMTLRRTSGCGKSLRRTRPSWIFSSLRADEFFSIFFDRATFFVDLAGGARVK